MIGFWVLLLNDFCVWLRKGKVVVESEFDLLVLGEYELELLFLSFNIYFLFFFLADSFLEKSFFFSSDFDNNFDIFFLLIYTLLKAFILLFSLFWNNLSILSLSVLWILKILWEFKYSFILSSKYFSFSSIFLFSYEITLLR